MQLETLTFSKAEAGGISGKPPRRRVQANAAAITRETASLTPCLRQKPWAGLGWRAASIAMSSADNTNGHPALRDATSVDVLRTGPSPTEVNSCLYWAL